MSDPRTALRDFIDRRAREVSGDLGYAVLGVLEIHRPDPDEVARDGVPFGPDPDDVCRFGTFNCEGCHANYAEEAWQSDINQCETLRALSRIWIRHPDYPDLASPPVSEPEPFEPATQAASSTTNRWAGGFVRYDESGVDVSTMG